MWRRNFFYGWNNIQSYKCGRGDLKSWIFWENVFASYFVKTMPESMWWLIYSSRYVWTLLCIPFMEITSGYTTWEEKSANWTEFCKACKNCCMQKLYSSSVYDVSSLLFWRSYFRHCPHIYTYMYEHMNVCTRTVCLCVFNFIPESRSFPTGWILSFLFFNWIRLFCLFSRSTSARSYSIWLCAMLAMPTKWFLTPPGSSRIVFQKKV